MNSLIFKFVVDGPPATGKTSLLNRIIGESFDPAHVATLGLEGPFVRKCKILNFNITARFFGIGGIETLNYILFYKGTAVVLLVFDLLRLNTINRVEDYVR